MLKTIAISKEELIEQISLSCQMPVTIRGIVNRKIIAAVAEKVGVTLEPEDLQQTADAFRLNHNLLSADATELWLQEHYLSFDQFEEIVQISALSSKLAQHLFGDKVEPFFVSHQLDYTQVLMYEVVLDDEDLAMELFYAIQEGDMSFPEVAHRYIQDKELRRSGGYRGKLRRTELKPEISAVIFASTPPQLLKPIITSKGAHLILVEEIIQPELDKTLRKKILSNLFLDWLKQQVDQVEVITEFQPESIEQIEEPSYSSSLSN
ncbi:peptidylprolyl isomerase (plasmid) [Tolypothrix sp. PCC 7910]|uniref:peptidylprolyl isomerase n=1 Tax=Tolypothrix sp. PCC 7910 TaxID=2099387 RepID=UPI001427842F|nr:peptidylprolyl isomerase [Tolypothrix sp. PCC 7910]QIR41865.1 peptidylprolyl isomerase [Tolypothrix sp. PCC 7910]